ncbi:hypothetical protein [Fonticella tunisiensis]|uniref:Uncharacterized protein n=1 Tax=Fonticella tunisiensis TaxID=1096341 RepID=A0A4R7KCX5_9CLOT|nr:hypothetical protein [Fonticella tunisiensis]TDT50546.1 hypothetical protein EDD71_1279 [Fonticella tunisiensis]
MRRAKIIAIVIIVFATFVSILYLIYEAKELERYTISPNDRDFYFILYSTSGGTLRDNSSVKGILLSCEKSLKSMGYDVLNLGIRGNADAREEIIKSVKGSKKYVLLDINATAAVLNKNTLLIKIGSRDETRYMENLEHGNKIKNTLKNIGIGVNILSDAKNGYNDDLSSISLRFEISKRNNAREGAELISKALGAMIR